MVFELLSSKYWLKIFNTEILDIFYTFIGIAIPTSIGMLRFKKRDFAGSDSYFAITFSPFMSKDNGNFKLQNAFDKTIIAPKRNEDFSPY